MELYAVIWGSACKAFPASHAFTGSDQTAHFFR